MHRPIALGPAGKCRRWAERSPPLVLQLTGELADRTDHSLGAVLDLDDDRAGLVGEFQALFGLVSAAGHAVHGSLGEVLVLLHHPTISSAALLVRAAS